MSRAKKIWQGWMDFNKDVAAFQGRLWMALIYFFVLGPISMLVRISGNPMLPPFDAEATFSHSRKPPEPTLEDARRQGA